MTKILVTGGAGFIGGNFVHYMIKNYPNYDIVCLDLLTYAGNLETLKSVINKNNFKFVKGDIADRNFIFGLFEKEQFDIVVNFAAESHVDRSIDNPGIFLHTNIIGTQVLMDASRAYGVKRYHQVSTDEVYGDLPLDRPELMFTETTPIHTSSPYSASKASADLLVQAYHRTFKLPITISRCSNNYGPYHFPEKLIPLMISRALNDESLPVYGKGENVRDWLHVYDHCTAIDLIIHKGRVGEVYNVGGHNERTNLEVVKVILDELNKSHDLITYVTDRAGHDLRYAINPGKLEKELGWIPKYNFETGIKQTIQWYLENKKWWEDIISGEYQAYYEKQYNERQPLISVIIPTYNRAYIIEESIKSILNQTYKNIEILVIDDVSTDDTKEICTKIQDDRIVYHRLERKLGAGGARQVGVSLSKGEYISFHDSDDFAYSNKLEIQLDYLQRKGFDIVGCKYILKDKQKNQSIIIPKYNVNDKESLYYKILPSNFIGTPLILAKRKVFEEQQFDTKLTSLEDWEIAIRITKQFKLGFINQVLYEANRQENSISADFVKEYNNTRNIYEKHLNDSLPNSVQSKMYYNLYMVSKKANLKNKKYIVKSFVLYPNLKALLRLIFP